MNESLSRLENQYWNSREQTLEFRHRAAIDLVKEKPVLDLGCGDGLFLKMLREKGVAGKGLDISKIAIEKCGKNNLDAMQFDFAANKLPLDKGEFPTVVALDVLEHLYEPEKLLEEIYRVSGKYLILSVPNFSSLPARMQMLIGKIPENNRPKKGHVYWMNLGIICNLLEKTGFKIEKIKMNTFWNKGLTGIFMKFCLKLFPQIFSLSFVIRAVKIDKFKE